jgi:hypothetical protein
MYVVTWKHGGGGAHQAALSIERAETIHRALCRALPDAHCEILPANDYTDSVAHRHQESRLVPRQGQPQRLRQRRRRRA